MTRAAWVPSPRALRAHSIHHLDDCFVISHFPDDGGDGFHTQEDSCVHPAVAGDHLVYIIPERADQDGRENAICSDAFYEILLCNLYRMLFFVY